jgi:hypothetical protein
MRRLSLGLGLGLGPQRVGGAAAALAATQDATSLKYVPADATEWAAVRTAAGVGAGAPSHLHGYQDASGDPQDSIGTLHMTIGAGFFAYQQTVSGWTRKGFQCTQQAGEYCGVVSGAPDLDAESALYLAYISLPTTPGGNRDIYSASPTLFYRVTTGDKLQINVNGVTADSTSSYVGIGVFPCVLAWNLAVSKVKVYTHLEKLAGTYDAAVTGNDYILGAYVGTASCPSYSLYDTIFKGAAAELGAANEAAFDSAVSALLTTLGWSVSW